MGTKRVAVVGGGIGGMTAAGELAKQGFEVVLFEASERLGGKAGSFTNGAVTLDVGPTLLAMPSVVANLFRRLGAGDLLPRMKALDHQCAYHFSDGCRFDVHQDFDRTVASAAELRPIERVGIRSFYEEAEEIYRAAGVPYLEAPYESLAEFMGRVLRRGLGAVATGMKLGTLHALAMRHFRTEHLQQFAGRFATYAGASPYEASAAFAQIAHIERAFGVHHIEGGMGALVEALRQAIERLGVRVHLGARARWRASGSGFLAGPEGGEEAFDAVVVNADPLSTREDDGVPLSLSGYVVLLEADRRLKLPHHTVLFSTDYAREFHELSSGRMPEEPTLYLCHPAATDPTMAAEGRSGLYMMANAPALPRGMGQAELRWGELSLRLPERCLALAKVQLPELREAKLTLLAERTPLDLARLGAPGGSIYGVPPLGRLGPFRRPRVRGKVPGLYYCGGGTQPGGGVPLVMLSGHFAACMAAEHLGARARAA